MTDKPYPQYACYCELDYGEQPSNCVVNENDHDSCTLAYTDSGRKRRTPNTCPYWRLHRGPMTKDMAA